MHQAGERFESAEQIEAALRAFVASWRRRMVLRRSLQAVTIILGVILIVALIHRIVPLPSLLREIVFDGFIGAALLRLLPAVAMWLRREVNLVQAAIRIERRTPALQQKLSTWMSGRLREEKSQLFSRLDQTLRFELSREAMDYALPAWPIGLAVVTVGLTLIVAAMSWRINDFIGATLPPWR